MIQRNERGKQARQYFLGRGGAMEQPGGVSRFTIDLNGAFCF